MSITVHGALAPGFEPVRAAFEDNVAERGELGAAFALMRDGEILCDLRAGWADKARTRPWSADTLVPVFSTGKAVTALVVAWMVDQGRLDYDAPLSAVWPDFAAQGKGAVTLAEALSHQAGLSGPGDDIAPDDWFDREKMEAHFAARAPMWPLGKGSGYHPLSFGVLADAAVRRADPEGRTVGELLREVIAGPRAIDCHIGLPESEHARAAEHVLPPRPPHLGKINAEKTAAFLRPGASPGRRGAAAWRSAELPAANAHATALSLARLMAPFACNGRLDGETFLGADTLAAALKPRISGPDRVLPFDLSFAAGVMINRDSAAFGPEPSAVGHYGFGGSCAFADPVRGLSGAYVMNRQMDVLVGDARARALIEAAYRCL
ncbi:beta-lactamase family protein [Alkalicaulis satelles]|uniref:Beta-lactamase family protein n=1 Tax=Alkalicaulis satelles TaxID=2609175 RepID=A0A5M6ZGB5_9PROT|nr:serine hydrolase domain-containing protein [Alkalicaulis satelles]KAA5803783.1 beta-lactamase family protein [Alkalicaulis satelles]